MHFNFLIESKHLCCFATEENDKFMTTGKSWELFKATLTFQSISSFGYDVIIDCLCLAKAT